MSHAASALPRKKLPLGIQTLAKLREEGCYYVDKSGLAIDLIASGSYFFLSRPRRFGKSLLVDTFKELFEGNRRCSRGWRPNRAGTGRSAIRSSASASRTARWPAGLNWSGASRAISAATARPWVCLVPRTSTPTTPPTIWPT